MALHVVDWQRAMTLVCKGIAERVETHTEGHLRTTSGGVSKEWGMPAVIRLVDFNFPPKGGQQYQRLNKHNLWMRDGGKCVYCDIDLSTHNMTADHVIPKSKGGKKSWDNLVCSCKKCNGKKGDKTPVQANMPLKKKPYAPTLNASLSIKIRKEISLYKIVPQTWKPYIFW